MNITLPAQIGILGDIHGSMSALVESFQQANKNGIDVIVQVGDNWLYDPSDLVDIKRQMDHYKIHSYFFIDGNHENFAILGNNVDTDAPWNMADNITYLGRGTRFMIGDKIAIALGGAVSVDRFTLGVDANGNIISPRIEGEDWWAREAVTAEDADTAIANGPADIIFSHDTTFEGIRANDLAHGNIDHPVSASDDYNSRNNLEKAVYSIDPKVLIHGHFHTYANGMGRDGINYVTLNMNGRTNNFAIFNSDDLTVTTVD